MKHLKVLLTQITAALGRLGSGAARREADEEIVRISKQGIILAGETINSNSVDFAQHYENWTGAPPQPTTPRVDPFHAAKARMGRLAEWFLLALKVTFWVIFGPAYFFVLAWLAVIVAVAISVPLSLGVKPLLAILILKPGMTPQQQERRLHANAVAGLVAFAIVFGSLFLLRGLAGPLALLGATLVLPIISACDMVLLYLMGIAHAYAQFYDWAAPFVRMHKDATAFYAAFARYYDAARKRLGKVDNDPHSRFGAAYQPPLSQPLATSAVAIREELQPTQTVNPANPFMTTIAVMLVFVLLGTTSASAQAPTAEIDVDSTISVYPSVAETMTPIAAHAFTVWAEQFGASSIRVATFERDGWLPRTVFQATIKPAVHCTSRRVDGSIFRGMQEAAQKQAQDLCDQERNEEETRVSRDLSMALTNSWKAQPLVNTKHRKSCTAFMDMLANTALVPAGNLRVIVSDTEETCSNSADPVPLQSAGALVILILVPSRTDLGPGVSAAARFNAKKAHAERIAPWLSAILAPAEVESYRLVSIDKKASSTVRAMFSQK